MRIAVLGAAGLMGSAIARDLAEDDEHDLTLLDQRGGGAVTRIDATDQQSLLLALEGHQLLVNAAAYRVNETAMDAALASGCGYVDLGGLYHVAARQLTRDAAFAERGLLAILGCGAGPGKTNVMAAQAAEGLDGVERVRCASAGLDEGGPSLPYALATLRDELEQPPMVWRDGAPAALEPLTDGGEVVFPEPVGPRRTLFTLHSEALTLGTSLTARDVDFRLALAPETEAALRAPDGGAALGPPSARTWSAQHVTVTGTRAGTPVRVTATALTRPHERWGLGGGVVSTATVASAVARLFARGSFGATVGVHPPERVVDARTLFPELEARGCTFTIDSEVLTP